MNDDVIGDLRRHFRRIRSDVSARLRTTDQERLAVGCLSIADVCRLAGHPDAIAYDVRRHLQSCGRCLRIYDAVLRGYPSLTRPEWLPESPDDTLLSSTQATPLYPALRAPMALVLMKDQERMNAEWARIMDPNRSLWDSILEHLMSPLQHLFRYHPEHRGPS